MRIPLSIARGGAPLSIPRMRVSRHAAATDEELNHRLVAAPKPGPCESLMGYVLRLTEANGYPTTSYILSSMHGHWYRSTYGRLDATSLHQLVGLSEADMTRMTMRPLSEPRAYIRVYGNDIPSYEVTLTQPKICPRCLDAGRCEAFWDLAQAAACPVHGVMLIDRCEKCGRPLTWTRSKVCECGCGADLRRCTVTVVDSDLCDLMSALRYFVYTDESIAELPPGMQHVKHLGLRRFCKLLWVMSGAIYQREGNSSLPKARKHYLPQLKRIGHAFADWPRGFQSFLHDLYDDGAEREGKQEHFGSCFSWLFVRLAKNDKGTGAPYAFLEEQAYRYGANHWTRGAMLRGENAQLPEGVLPRWGTAADALTILGVHPVTLRRLIGNGTVPVRLVGSTGTPRSRIIDLEWARKQRFTRFPPVMARDAARAVGVSVATLKCMKANGLYEAKHRGANNSEWAQEDVSTLVSKLSAIVPEPYIERRGTPTIGTVLSSYLASASERAEFFSVLLDSPQVVVGHKGRKFNAGHIQIKMSDANEIMRRVRRNVPIVLAQAAAKRLHCSADVITALKRAGHLKTLRQGGRIGINRMSLLRFEERYEALPLLMRRLGGCVRRAYHRLPLREIRHLRVRGSQVTSVFVDRRDVPIVQMAVLKFGFTVRCVRGRVAATR